jgi:protein-disulfide isomerase
MVDGAPDANVGHSYGNPDAPIVVVEFGDLECPYCRAAAPILRRLVEDSGGAVRQVWRHFPLFEVHPYGLTAALAAEAVSALAPRDRPTPTRPAGTDPFWAMHDLCMSHQDRLADPYLRGYAEELGIDGEEAVGDRAQRFAGAVLRDYQHGGSIGVRGTPTVFVDGERLAGRVETASLQTAVERALARR